MAKRPDDETLMAYVDGALPDTEMTRVASLLESNPELKARLLPFELTRERLPDLISGALAAPAPDRLLHTVMTAPIGAAGAANTVTSTTPLIRRLARAMLPEMPVFAGGLALGTCIILIASGGFIAARFMPASDHPLAISASAEAIATGSLEEALETIASGRVLEHGLLQVTPVLTVRDSHGRICRQYAVQRAGADAVSGFACRSDEGRWSIAFHAPQSAAGASTPESKSTGYEPASGEPGDALDRFIDKAGGEALTSADEAELISKGWVR